MDKSFLFARHIDGGQLGVLTTAISKRAVLESGFEAPALSLVPLHSYSLLRRWQLEALAAPRNFG